MQPAPRIASGNAHGADWRNSLVLAGLFLAIAGGGWLLLSESKARSTTFLMRGDPGPFFLGDLCLAAIGIGGALLLIRAGVEFLRRDLSPFRVSWSARDWLRWLVPALFIATLVVMPVAMRGLGTPAALGLFALAWIAALLQLSGVRGWRLALGPVLGGLVTAGFIQIVFIRLLSLPLPG